MESVLFKRVGLTASTCGLSQRGLPEFRIEVNSSSLLDECESFLSFVVDYLLQSEARIKPGETLNFGYWLVKFEAVTNGLLEVWEYNPEATDFVRGGSLALHYWRDQHRICRKFGAEFAPPRADKLTVVSAGVMEGLPVQAVRYAWQEHMSGWLLATKRYDGDIGSLTHHHTYHVTAARPDLAPYIALPVGFRFDLTTGENVWFDKEVAEQPPI